MAFYIADGKEKNKVPLYCSSDAWSAGAIVAYSSGVYAGINATTGQGGSTAFIGISVAAVTTGNTGEVELFDSHIVVADYTTAGTKTSFGATDIGTVFDMSSAKSGKIHPDYTSGGFFLLTGYDNTSKKAYGRIIKPARYI